jgi:hypothetical protein
MFSGCEHTTPLPAILVLGGQLRPSFSAGRTELLTRTAVRCVRYSSMLAMISATLCTSVSSSSSRSAMVDGYLLGRRGWSVKTLEYQRRKGLLGCTGRGAIAL